MKASNTDKRVKTDNFLYIIKNIIKRSKNFCAFKDPKSIDIGCYLLDEDIEFAKILFEKYLFCCEVLNMDSYFIDELRDFKKQIDNPEKIGTHERFLMIWNDLIKSVDSINDEFISQINKLTCNELIRLDESIHCFEEYCYYSCTILAVSAVEARLHYLLEKTDKKLYKRTFEKATIGQCIQLLDPGKYKDLKYKKFKKLIPNEYKSLIELLNHYRILSAHPKGKKISQKVAQTVINLSFVFLLDDITKIGDELLLSCR